MRTLKHLCIAAAVLGLCAAETTRSWAADGKWNADNGGNWSDTSRWTNSQVAGGIGSIANIEFNITADRTITLDQPVTVGRLRFNDATTASHNWILAGSGANILTLQVSSGVPIVDVNNQTATINAGVAGTQGLLKIGGGNLALTAPANAGTLSGKIVITNGTLRATSEACLGAYPANFVADQIQMNRQGRLMNNNSDLVISVNNGISLGVGGGGLQAGWGRSLTVNSVISGAESLTIRSDATPGPIILNAVNTYTGATIIGNSTANNSWALAVIEGSLHASSAVSVTANGALSGKGTVNGPVTVNAGGIVNPGNLVKAGTLTVNNSVTVTNGFLMVDLADVTTEGGGVNDLLQVNGDLTLQGTVTVSINARAGKLANGTYRLINYTGNGTFTGATLVCDNPNFSATFDTSIPGQVNMTIASGNPVNLTWTGTAGPFWEIAGMANFQKAGTAAVFNQGDSVTFDDTGVYTDPVTMSAVGPNFGMIQPSAIYVNTTKDVTLTSVGTARLGGSAPLFKGGPGMLSLTYASDSHPNIHDGILVVTNGLVKPLKAGALGSIDGGTYISNGSTLDVNALNLGAEPFYIEGAGVNGAGALVNTAGAQNNALRVVTMTGNATVGGTGRFDIRNFGGDAFLHTGGNPYKLTKVGANQFSLVGVQTDPALGEVEVLDGTFGYETTSTLGDSTKNLTLGFDTSLRLWNLSNGFYKPLVLNGGTARFSIDNGSGDNTITGPVTLNAQTLWNVPTGTLTVDSGITGVGGLTKLGATSLTLNGVNTYTGETFVNAGTLTLGPGGSLANTSLIAVNSGATLDVSQTTGLTLGSGQTLSGAGTVSGAVNAGSGSTLVPGTSPGTLAINGALSLNNATLDFELGGDPLSPTSDQITALGVTAAGVNTIKIRPLAPLSTANPYNLIANFGTAMPSGTEANFTVTSDSRYSFTVLPTDATAGVNLQVQVSGTPAAALTWRGNDSVNPTLWDVKTTANWLNGATADKFFAGDAVTFDDTALGTTATLVGKLQPSAMVFNNVNKPITLNGAGSLVTPSLSVDGTGTVTLANDPANQFVAGITNNGGTLIIANDAANDYGPALTLNAGTVVLDQDFDLTLSTPLLGAGTLRKDNTNLLVLPNANSLFDGTITVDEGILRVGNAASLGTIAGPTVVNAGGTLNVNGLNLGNEVVHVQGAGFGGVGAIINTGAGQNNALHDMVLTGDATFGGPARWDLRSANMTIPATLVMQGGLPHSITKIGGNQFSLVNVSVDAALGDIDVKGGVFSYEAGTTGLGDPSKALTLRPGATMLMWGTTVPINKQVALEDGSTFRSGSGTANQVVGPVTLSGGQANLGAASGTTLFFFGPIGGAGGINKVEPGSVHLVASNYFEGDVVVDYGNLVLSNSYALGTNKTVLVDYNTGLSGGAGTRLYLRGGITTPQDLTAAFTSLSAPGLDYRTSITGDSLTNTWAGPMLLEGSGIVGFYSGAGTNIFNVTGPILGTNGFSGTAFFRGSAGFGGTISGKIDMPNGVLALTDNTTWRIENPANAWRQTTIAYGRIILGADNAVCSTAPVVLGQSGSSTGWLDLNGFNQTVPSLTTVNGANHFITNGSATANSVFTFDGGTNVSTLNGRILDNGIGKLSLTVSSGSLTLLGNNTYLGNTVISGGTLALGSAGTLTSTPLITLASGAVLDTSAKGAAGLALAASQKLEGSGTVDGSLTVGSTATLAPAASAIGAITITNALTCAAGGTVLVDVNSTAIPASDVINAASIVYGGTLSLNNAGPAYAAGNSFKLFNAATYGGAFAAIVPATPGEGLAWDTSTLGIDGTLKVKLAVSTEPTNITMEMTSGGFDLSWPSTHIGWRLETQTNPRTTGLSNNWTTYPGSTTTNKVSISYENTETTVFFRLVYP